MFMVWPLFLPMKITLGILVSLVVASTIVAHLRKGKGGLVFAVGVGIAILAFVPCCAVVKLATDPYQLGVFVYPDGRSFSDRYVQLFLPAEATHITIEKGINRYRAKFTIGKQSLDDWFEQQWKRDGKRSIRPRASSGEAAEFGPEWFKRQCGDLGWVMPPDAIEYDGPRYSSGAGSIVYYSESEGVAYQLANYW